MTQEDKKELLIKDLFARLPYGVKCKDQYGDYIDVNIYNAHIEHLIDQILSGVVQMVLRPMSSMTEKEKIQYQVICESWMNVLRHYDVDWLNEHHFDYRGLIEKSLALEAFEGMYDTNQKWTTIRSGLKENENGQIVGGLKL